MEPITSDDDHSDSGSTMSPQPLEKYDRCRLNHSNTQASAESGPVDSSNTISEATDSTACSANKEQSVLGRSSGSGLSVNVRDLGVQVGRGTTGASHHHQTATLRAAPTSSVFTVSQTNIISAIPRKQIYTRQLLPHNTITHAAHKRQRDQLDEPISNERNKRTNGTTRTRKLVSNSIAWVCSSDCCAASKEQWGHVKAAAYYHDHQSHATSSRRRAQPRSAASSRRRSHVAAASNVAVRLSRSDPQFDADRVNHFKQLLSSPAAVSLHNNIGITSAVAAASQQSNDLSDTESEGEPVYPAQPLPLLQKHAALRPSATKTSTQTSSSTNTSVLLRTDERTSLVAEVPVSQMLFECTRVNVRHQLSHCCAAAKSAGSEKLIDE